MCGIAGFLRLQGMDDGQAESLVRRMCNTFHYRGPDEEGYHIDHAVALGMKRLTIIDLKTGSQPMRSDDGQITLVYNGEVYNYRALRTQLQEAGHSFRTTSDTEVVLKAYEQYGTQAFSMFAGMFALAIEDRNRGLLVLCRDPVGIKPLYYSLVAGSLVFASELKALMQVPGISRALNEQAVWDYLTYEYVPGPQTIIQGIQKLPPGHMLSIPLTGGVPTPVPYRDFVRHNTYDGGIYEAEANFSELFSRVVEEHLVADVPVGVLLSGGLDSTAIAAVACGLKGPGVKTFCVGFKERTLTDETVLARMTANYLGTEHHEHVADAREFVAFVDQYVHLMDEPNADMAAIGKYFAYQTARQHVKVVLSGDGGDEVMCGYRMNEAMQRFNQLRALQRHLPPAAFVALEHAVRSLGLRTIADRVKMAAIPLGRRNSLALPSMTRQYSEMEKACLFGGRSAGLQDSMRILKDDFETASTLQPVTQIQYAWSKQWLAEHLLMQSDRMSMCVSLELRVPFLDIRLVDLLFSMPDSHKVRSIGGTLKGKYLLRQFLAGRVPDEVFHRPKRGFQIPNISFINNELRSEITATLRDPQARIYGLMDRQQVEKRIARIGPVEGDCQKVWMLFVLEKWLRKWMG